MKLSIGLLYCISATLLFTNTHIDRDHDIQSYLSNNQRIEQEIARKILEQHESHTKEDEHHVVNVLLEGYQRDLRPHMFSSKEKIYSDLTLTGFGPISDKRFEYRISMFHRVRWQDPRLDYTVPFVKEKLGIEDENDPLILSAEIANDIWIPDTYFINSKGQFLIICKSRKI